MSLFDLSNLTVQGIIDSFNKGTEAANTANDDRYQGILSLLNALQGRSASKAQQITTETANVGDVARQRLGEQANQLFSNQQQSLISGGLGNSTLLNAAMRNAKNFQKQGDQEIDEQQAQLRAGNLQNEINTDMSTSNLLAGVMERRNDVAPDLGQYAALLQGALSSGTGATKRKVTIGPGSSSYGGSFRAVSQPTMQQVGSGRTGVTRYGR